MLTTVAVPIVVYGLMPLLHKGRARLITRSAHNEDRVDGVTQARPKQPNQPITRMAGCLRARLSTSHGRAGRCGITSR